MFLKDHLKDIYQKASSDKNNLMLENIINRWAHRFGPETLNELFVKNKDQIKLTEKDQAEINQNQTNLELLENVQYEEDSYFEPKETKKSINTEIIDKDIYESYKYKSEFKKTEELPLPDIKNLRKWIKNEKKAS